MLNAIIISIYGPHNRSSKYMGKKMIAWWGERYSSSIVTRDFSTYSIRDKTTRQKISKEIEDLNDTICQLDLTSIYWIPNSDIQDHIVCEQR